MGVAAIALIAIPAAPQEPQSTPTIEDVYELLVKGMSAQASQSPGFEEAFRQAIEAGERVAVGEPHRAEELGSYMALAYHGLATWERDTGEVVAALHHVERAQRTLVLAPRFEALLLSMEGDLFLELGLPDRAAEPTERAVQLALEDLQRPAPDGGTILLAHTRRCKQLLAVERYRDAAELMAGIEAAIDWDQVFGAFGPDRIARERAMLATYRGVAWSLAALHGTEIDPEAAHHAALDALDSVLAEPCARAADRFTARGRLAGMAVRSGDSARASELLASMRAEAAAAARPLPREEEAWICALEASVAERAASPLVRALALARLGAAFHALMAERRAVDRVGGVGYFRYGRARLVIEELVALSTPEDALRWVLESHEVGATWHAFGRPRPGVASVVRDLARPKTGTIVFVNGEARAQCLVVDDRGETTAHVLGNAREVMTLAREYGAQLRTHPARGGPRRSQVLHAHGERLAEVLFPEDVRRKLREWTAVRIVGRDLLEMLPVEALPVIDGEALGRERAVSELPSLALACELARRVAPAATAPPLLVVAPRLAEAHELPPLEVASVTLRALEEAARSPIRVLRADSATIPALRGALEARPAWAHLITHGIRNDALELGTSLLLTSDAEHPDGALGVELVRTMRAPTLVILSSCHAGGGSERTGDSAAAHFGGAFLTAGARCVLLSADQVQLDAALAMSEAVYAALAKGCSPAEALRRARVALASDPRWSDPFHWALLEAYGYDV